MKSQRAGPRALPVLEYDEQKWFIDERLGEFRDARNPSNRVGFDTEEGRRMQAVCLAIRMFGRKV